MKDRVFGWVLPFVPKNELSHFVGKLAHKRLPDPLARLSVNWFAKYYKINMDEAEYPLDHYKTIGELFTRHLKPGARPVAQEGYVHPADALITQAGRVEDLTLIQAKGKDYSLPEFLRSSFWSERFNGGSFLTYYLCPTDYHRVHSPVDGKIVWSCHVPGEMWPVNQWSVRSIPSLFNLNERVVLIIETPTGVVALVMVAATNVGNMTMSFDENIKTNVRASGRAMKEKTYDEPTSVHRGDEVGVFNMGSTVVAIYEPGMLTGDVTKLKGERAKMGASLFE